MLWATMSLIGLFGKAALVILSVLLCRARRTRAFALLMWACISFVIARSSWFPVGFVQHYFPADEAGATRESLFRWRGYVDSTFQMLFIALMIGALIVFLRERSSVGTSHV